MIKAILPFVSIFLISSSIGATPLDWKDKLQTDLETPLPNLTELQTKYPIIDNHDNHYDYSWNLGTKFDSAFKEIIKSYGTSEKRLKPDHEENLLEMISMMPKETYPYIGPYLHTVPGMSEKILNLPGIKETKNQFPKQVAKRFQNMEGLEFLSPSLYYILMPEEITQNRKYIEKPYPTSRPPKVEFDEEFFTGIQKLVKPSNYNPENKDEARLSKSELRTISPTKNSLITGSDIGAFLNTLPELNQLTANPYFSTELFAAGRLLEQWENDNGTGVPLPLLKDLINPCARLVQKFRLTGKEQELAAIVAKQGFNTTEWAYTCDKSIRAYRTARMSRSTAASLRIYKKNLFAGEINKLPKKHKDNMELISQAVIEMYDAPLSDTIEAQKIYDKMQKSFLEIGSKIINIPIDIFD